MKIEKQQLVELLVVKTGLDKKSVEKQLEELVSRIKDAADRGKALEVKGFGLFYYSEVGDLKFDPSEEFKTEVNFKYSGMEPIEVQEGVPEEELDEILSEEEVTDIGEEVEDEDIWGVENGKEPAEKTVEDKEEESIEDELIAGKEGDTAEEEPQAEENKFEAGEKDEPADEKAGELSAEKEEKETETEAEDKEASPDDAKEPEKEKQEIQASEKKEPKKDDRFADLIGSAFDSLKDESEETEEESGKEEDIFAAEDDPFNLDEDETGKEPEKSESEAIDSGDKKETVEKKPESRLAAGTKKTGQPSATKKKSSYAKKSYKNKEQEQGIPINTIIVSVTVFLIIVVGYFVVTDLTQPQTGINTSSDVAQQDLRRNGQNSQAGEDPAEETSGSEQTEAGETEAAGAESTVEDETETDSGAENQVQDESGAQNDNDSDPASVENGSPDVYGLTGTVNESISSGFTIVVHSLTEESRAIEVMEELRNEGYRAMIFARNIQDRGTVWRIGLGQFENRDIASETAAGLPEPYNTNHFIQRIQ